MNMHSVFVWLVLLTPSVVAQERPNVLFIMSDDHTTQAIGAYGSRLARLNPTPQIDALAARGMRFDRVFCNNAICTPSRASILTGQYPQSNGVLDLRGNLPPERQLLAHEMRRAGYHTAVVGKWHLKQEPAAFEHYVVLPGQGKYHDPIFRQRGDQPWPKNTLHKRGQHSSDAITDFSIEWLRGGWDRERPFFLMHHFKAPHDMFVNARRYDRYLEDVEIPEPASLRAEPGPRYGSVGSRGFGSGLTKGHESWQLGRRLGIDPDLEEPRYSEAVYQKYLKRYLRCVKGVDDNVGRLLGVLSEMGELENTVVIYTSDQGFFLGERDLMDKRWMYEEAMRMPFIVHHPKTVEAGSTCDWLINNTDFAPTILELAKRQVPGSVQGRSFASALKGEPRPADWRTATYYRYWMHMAHRLRVPAHFGLRTERYKLIFFYGCTPDGKQQTPVAWELYDLLNDPFETNNLYGEEASRELVKGLKEQLRELRRELGETDARYPAIREIVQKHGL